jgi:Putative peptidoglycan binding domain/CHAP domain
MSRTLFVTSPMMKGQDVVALQARLHDLGYFPGVRDGNYGPATAGAVRTFQRDFGLKADGACGARTFQMLETATGAVRDRRPSAIALAALTEAARHIGVCEDPPESNSNPFGKWFGLDEAPWCAIFISYCFSVGAGYTVAQSLLDKAPGVHPNGCAYVPSMMAWLFADGFWVGRTEPIPGDIVIYNWDGGRVDHIGIVESNPGNGQICAIEGNTSAADASNGGEVQRTTRPLRYVTGFGRVA